MENRHTQPTEKAYIVPGRGIVAHKGRGFLFHALFAGEVGQKFDQGIHPALPLWIKEDFLGPSGPSPVAQRRIAQSIGEGGQNAQPFIFQSAYQGFFRLGHGVDPVVPSEKQAHRVPAQPFLFRMSRIPVKVGADTVKSGHWCVRVPESFPEHGARFWQRGDIVAASECFHKAQQGFRIVRAAVGQIAVGPFCLLRRHRGQCPGCGVRSDADHRQMFSGPAQGIVQCVPDCVRSPEYKDGPGILNGLNAVFRAFLKVARTEHANGNAFPQGFRRLPQHGGMA